MSTRFFTNHGEQTLFKKFRGVFESNLDIECFDALVGYLRSSGYFALRPHLEKVPHIRILAGIDVDAIMSDYHRRGLLFLADPARPPSETAARLDWHRNQFKKLSAPGHPLRVALDKLQTLDLVRIIEGHS